MQQASIGNWELGIGYGALGIRSVGGVGGWRRNLSPHTPNTPPSAISLIPMPILLYEKLRSVQVPHAQSNLVITVAKTSSDRSYPRS
ncbi:hypothetical protein [Nostoc sp. CCY 9925]|uniref:hypothetical protein n=1 Tax=Nostoc sp. CCY 9925 TaxID=3103865 RepID=UPI0039C73C49